MNLETAEHPAVRRRVPIWLLIVLGVALLAAIAALIYRFMPLDAPIPGDVGRAYAGLERGTTDEGFPRLGEASAPVLVEVFSSFACPHCRTFHEEQFAGLLDEIAAGQVQFVFIPIAHIGRGAGTAAHGALCAGEQDRFWEMHDVLFYWQGRTVGSAFPERRVKLGAENLGLDTAAFNQCMDDSQPEAVLDRARAEFDRRGLTGTPSLFIDGQRVQDYSELEQLGGPDASAASVAE
jgi:protein-disulfide isomerase